MPVTVSTFASFGPLMGRFKASLCILVVVPRGKASGWPRTMPAPSAFRARQCVIGTPAANFRLFARNGARRRRAPGLLRHEIDRRFHDLRKLRLLLVAGNRLQRHVDAEHGLLRRVL